MKITVVDDPAAVVAAARARIQAAARAAIEARGRFALALAGGATPRALYRAIAETEAQAAAQGDASAFDWPRVDLYFGDERCVSPAHHDSNFRAAVEALSPGPAILRERLFRMRGEIGTTAAGGAEAAAEYAAMLASGLGPGGALDLALLGVGTDGHTASLFPRSPALAERDASCVWVPAAGLAPFVPRFTLTFPVFERARALLFLVTGAEKAGVLRDVASGPERPDDLPARRLARLPQAEILADRTAAAKLPA